MSHDPLHGPLVHDDWAVEEAVANLGTADAIRLELAAETWFDVNELYDLEYEPVDLLAEAIARTLSGARGWRTDVGFVLHLEGTMRSIASSWRKRLARERAAGHLTRSLRHKSRGQQLLFDGNESFSDTLDQVPTGERHAETRLLAADRVRGFVEHFARDPQASAVLAGWFEGRKGPQIQAGSGMTKKQFEAAVLRIRRFAQREKAANVH